MTHHLRMFVACPLTLVCLAIFCRSGAIQAAPTDQKPARAASAPSKLTAPVNVNVTVNVRVSHDTKVDVRIDGPFSPVIGSLQIPDFVQQFVSGLLKTPTKPVPKDSSSRPPSP